MKRDERTLLVGLDGRQHDADSLALARTLHATLGGRLVLVHVIPPPPLGRGMTGYAWQARSEGRELLARAAEASGAPSETRLLETWPAAFALAQLAEDRHASMLVLASSHRGAVGRIVPGGVVSQLLARGPCPLAVAPVGYAEQAAGAVSCLGVAYDASSESDIALEAAGDAATRLGVGLRIYHAMHEISEDPAWDEFRAHMRRVAQAIIDAGLRRLPPGLEAATSVLEGDAAALAEAAHKDKVGVLYVGSRGYGPLREAILGGFTGALLRTARCPLVIVPCRVAGAETSEESVSVRAPHGPDARLGA